MTSATDSLVTGRLRRARSWWLLLAVLGLAIAQMLRFAWNEDSWWYITSGDAVLRHGGIPDEDVLLYPSLTGWVSHSWLWTVVIALLHHLGGLTLVLLFSCALAVGIAWTLFDCARVDRLGVCNAVVAGLCLWAAGSRLSIKTELVTWLFAMGTFLLLEGRHRGNRWLPAWIAVSQLLWSNLHGGFFVGIAVIGAYTLGDWTEHGIARLRSRREMRDAARTTRVSLLALPAAIAGSIVTPPPRAQMFDTLGWAGNVATGRESTLVQIAEWLPTFAGDVTASHQQQFVLFLVLGLASFALTRWPWRLSRLAFLLLAAGLGFGAVRFVYGFALLCGLVVLRNLAQPAPWLARAGRALRGGAWRLAYRGLALVTGLALACAASLLLWGARLLETGQSSGSWFTVDPQAACPELASYLEEQAVPGPVFNDVALGGYLGYRLYPERLLFIDPRNISQERLRDYTKALDGGLGWATVQIEHGFRGVAFSNLRQESIHNALRRDLMEHPGWRVAFLDEHAVLFLAREEAASRPGVVRLPEALPWGALLSRSVRRPLLLVDVLFRGQLWTLPRFHLEALLSLARWSECLAACEQLLERDPGNLANLQIRAVCRFNLGQVEGALADSQAILSRTPGNAQIVLLHARIQSALGRPEEGLRILDAFLERVPGHERARRLRARLADETR